MGARCAYAGVQAKDKRVSEHVPFHTCLTAPTARGGGGPAGLKWGRPSLRMAHHEPPWPLWRRLLRLSRPKQLHGS